MCIRLRSRRTFRPTFFGLGNLISTQPLARAEATDPAEAAAGLMENVSPHWLRHAAITLWATEMGLPAAQRLAGHKNATTTSRYLGGSDAELKALNVGGTP